MFKHIHSKRCNKLSVERMNNLVFVHYNLRLRTTEILDSDTSRITLQEVDLEFEWVTKATEPVFDDEDLAWIDQVDKEGEAVAMALEEHRAIVDPSGTSQAKTMVNQSSKTYLRCLTMRHNIDYSKNED